LATIKKKDVATHHTERGLEEVGVGAVGPGADGGGNLWVVAQRLRLEPVLRLGVRVQLLKTMLPPILRSRANL
jgi:hypothetical protein